MRTGGYFHETAFYGSDAEFLEIVAPFLADGLSAGDPVVAAFAGTNQALIRAAFGEGAGIRYVDGDRHYARPASAIHRYRQMMGELVAAGAKQIRIAGDVPHPGVGMPWDWWCRYEAAVNDAYDDFPLWGLCPYDMRTTPEGVLDDVRRTHPHVATAGGHTSNPAYEDPREFLRRRATTWRDPLEAQPAAVDLTDPSAALLRAAIDGLAGRHQLPVADVEDLRLAASEAVSNALLHGTAPVRARIWVAPDRVLVTVHDAGPGPDDPYAGLLPVDVSSGGGRGLWLIHQLCAYVTIDRLASGTTVRMLAQCVNAGTGR